MRNLFLSLFVFVAVSVLVVCGGETGGQFAPIPIGDGSTVVTVSCIPGSHQRQCVGGQSCQFWDDCVSGTCVVVVPGNVCAAAPAVGVPPAGSSQPARSFSAAGDSSLAFANGADLDRTTSSGRVCVIGAWVNQNQGRTQLLSSSGTVVQVISCRRNNPADCNPSPANTSLNLSYWAVNPLNQPNCRLETDCRGSPQVLCY